MENSRDTTSGPRDVHSLEKPYEARQSGPGWIRTSDTQNDDSGLGEPRGANESVGDGGSQPSEPVALLPELSLEDRLAVALAGRGAQRIGEFLEKLAVKLDNVYLHNISALSDEALVEAVERQVRGDGDDGGLLRAERGKVSLMDARPTFGMEAAQ